MKGFVTGGEGEGIRVCLNDLKTVFELEIECSRFRDFSLIRI